MLRQRTISKYMLQNNFYQAKSWIEFNSANYSSDIRKMAIVQFKFFMQLRGIDFEEANYL